MDDIKTNNIIEIDGLNFKYKNITVFDELNLNIKQGSFTTIIGPNSSGKSTLVKLLLGLARGNTIILCEGLPITKHNLKTLRKDIGYIYGDDLFINETVIDEIAFTLENLNISKKEISTRIKSIANKLKIEPILEKNPYNLNKEQKWLLKLASALVINPKLLIIDDGFTCLHPKKRKIVLDLLNKLNKKDLTIITTTNDIEEVMYAEDIILLENGKAQNIKKEELLEELVGTPFIISLCEKLKLYELIEKTYLEEEKLVNVLWK